MNGRVYDLQRQNEELRTQLNARHRNNSTEDLMRQVMCNYAVCVYTYVGWFSSTVINLALL